MGSFFSRGNSARLRCIEMGTSSRLSAARPGHWCGVGVLVGQGTRAAVGVIQQDASCSQQDQTALTLCWACLTVIPPLVMPRASGESPTRAARRVV